MIAVPQALRAGTAPLSILCVAHLLRQNRTIARHWVTASPKIRAPVVGAIAVAITQALRTGTGPSPTVGDTIGLLQLVTVPP